jgi:hypothetical protein
MHRGANERARAGGWRAWTARLLAAAVLLASLLVPPLAGDAGAAASPFAAASSAAPDQDGAPDAPSRPDGSLHAGAHCACQIADRLQPPEQAAPASSSAVVHPLRTAHALASLAAEPPARPPRT